MTTSRSATLVVRLGALLGPLTAESALAGAAGVLGWEPGWATGLVTVTVVAGPSATVALTRQWAPPWALGLILLSAFVAAVGLYESVQLSVLAASGRTTAALVVSEQRVARHTRSGTTYAWRYALESDDGKAIPGQLDVAEDWFDVGGRVEVFYDPAGRTDPRLENDVRDRAIFWMFPAVGGLVTGITSAAVAFWSLSDERVTRWRARTAARQAKSARTLFRPLGRRRRVIGRIWFGCSSALTTGAIVVIAAGSGSWSRSIAMLVLLAGAFALCLSLAPAFGRDNRTD